MIKNRFQVVLLLVLFAAGSMSMEGTRITPLGTLVRGNTVFAVEMYHKMGESKGNLFFSPVSLSVSLGMTHAGARGNTADEMARILRFKLPDSHLHMAFSRLLKSMDRFQKQDGLVLYTANAIWPQAGYSFQQMYLNLLGKYFSASVTPVDYKNKTENARITINQWVSEKTGKMIPELLPRGILDVLTRLVLTNAVYFKGDWQRTFDSKYTREEFFYLTEKNRLQVPIMRQTNHFGYAANDTFSIVALPYSGDQVSMLIVLPKEINGLAELEKNLSAENVEDWIVSMKKQRIRVQIPKFEMSSAYQLKEILKSLGMKDAFDMKRADFSGMDGSRWLFIDEVIHQAEIVVNESGSEASAATAVVMKKKGGPPNPIPTFRADHPFLFFIQDVKTRSILFMGRYVGPTE